MRISLFIFRALIVMVASPLLSATDAHASSQATKDFGVLQAGAPLEHDLSDGEKHSYRIALASGDSLHLRINVWGIGNTIETFDPDNHQLFSATQVEGFTSIRIFVLAEKAGEYRLEITAKSVDKPTGRYEVKVVALAAATAEDQSRFAAQRLGLEAQRLYEQHTPESLREAIEKDHVALGLWKSLSDLEGQGAMLAQMGFFYYFLAEKRIAIDYMKQALPLIQAAGNSVAEASVLNDLGVINREIGEPHEALKYHEQSLSLKRALSRVRPIESRSEEALLLYNISIVYRDLGEHQKALDNLNQTLALWRGSGLAHTLYNIGAVYARLGEPQQALNYYSQAMSIWRNEENNPNTGASKKLIGQRATGMLVYIGAVYASTDRWDQALENYQQALKRARADNFWELEAFALNKMGAAHLSLGDYQQALGCFNQALPVFRKISDRVREADALRGIGEVHLASGDPQVAVQCFNQALTIQRSVADQVGEAATRYATARAHRDLDQLTEARREIETALDLIESLRTKVSSQELRASYVASKQDYYDFYIDLLMMMHASQPNGGYAALALQANERSRARSLLEILTEAGADIRQGVDPTLLTRELAIRQRLNAKAERQTQMLNGKHTEEQAAQSKKEIETLLTEYREAQAKIRTSSPRYAALTQPQPLGLSQIQQQALDPDTLLLEYSLGKERSYLWVVTRTSLATYTLPRRSEIERSARRAYELLSHKKTQLKTPTKLALAELSQMILGPVAGHLSNKRLLIVADGALQYVPFGALPVPGTPGASTPLVANHEISYLPSASAAVALRSETGRQGATKAVAVLADPVLENDDSRVTSTDLRAEPRSAKSNTLPLNQALTRSASESGLPGFERLKFTRQEAAWVSALAPAESRMVALDFEASKSTATSLDLRQYRMVHFATHGLINSQNPELSGLVLSLIDKSGRAQDGFLRLHDIYNLRLNADLVVLSACRTALGKDVRGEGLMGLTRGFMYAGASKVVASLWDVRDEATAELMKRFYEAMLKRHLRPGAALREAQLSLMKEKQWESPYYWAGFVLQGDAK